LPKDVQEDQVEEDQVEEEHLQVEEEEHLQVEVVELCFQVLVGHLRVLVEHLLQQGMELKLEDEVEQMIELEEGLNNLQNHHLDIV